MLLPEWPYVVAYMECIYAECNMCISINSLRPSDAYYWFQKWLVAWTAPSHYLNQYWNIVTWTLRNKLKGHFNQNSKIFIQEIAFENVICKMASILSGPQWVNSLRLSTTHMSHNVAYSQFLRPWDQTIPRKLGQYHGCWWSSNETSHVWYWMYRINRSWGHFKNTFELLNLRAVEV